MEATRLFLNPTVKEGICSNLSFEDAIRFRNALGLPSLKCSITVIDPRTEEKIILPGVNLITIEAYELIKQYGLNQAFIIAAEDGLNSVVQNLITAGADVDAVDRDGLTALMLASANGHDSVVQTLTAAKAK